MDVFLRRDAEMSRRLHEVEGRRGGGPRKRPGVREGGDDPVDAPRIHIEGRTPAEGKIGKHHECERRPDRAAHESKADPLRPEENLGAPDARVEVRVRREPPKQHLDILSNRSREQSHGESREHPAPPRLRPRPVLYPRTSRPEQSEAPQQEHPKRDRDEDHDTHDDIDSAGVNFVLHAAGWLEGGLTLSYEKLIMDADQLGMMEVYAKGIDVSENGQAMQAFHSNPPGQHFLGNEHTLANFETAFYRSSIADNNSYEQWSEEGSLTAAQRANARWKEMLASYEAPALDPAVDKAMLDYIAGRKAGMPDEIG